MCFFEETIKEIECTVVFVNLLYNDFFIFKNNEEEYRPRNVAKLLFINMLGHNTDFG